MAIWSTVQSREWRFAKS